MSELEELLRSPYADDAFPVGTNVLLVDLDLDLDPDLDPGAADGLDAGSFPIVIVGVHHGSPPGRPATAGFDTVVEAGDPLLDAMIASIDLHPLAAASLAVLLRGGGRMTVEQGLAAESAVYSLLQSGPEFAAWRSGARNQPSPESDDAEPAVVGTRCDDELIIELNRPLRHNAFGRAVRNELCAWLALALVDDAIRAVHLKGRGPSFCSGGDLAEFGSFTDPATAHIVRLSRSPARLLHRLAVRTHVHLHGACMGAGIELPAFAHHVTASADTIIALPELGLGLIPGAGGTVSLPRRIGRHRTAYLAFSGGRISAGTALEWGLVDALT